MCFLHKEWSNIILGQFWQLNLLLFLLKVKLQNLFQAPMLNKATSRSLLAACYSDSVESGLIWMLCLISTVIESVKQTGDPAAGKSDFCHLFLHAQFVSLKLAAGIGKQHNVHSLDWLAVKMATDGAKWTREVKWIYDPEKSVWSRHSVLQAE